MIKEFKEFIMRGNVLDLAVGLVMGSAFTAIVTALVEAIIMPLVNAMIGKASVEQLSVAVGPATLQYGLFLQAIINFLLVALVLFFIIKGVNSLTARTRRQEEIEEEVTPTAEDYLAEIRDLLAAQNNESIER